MRAGQASPLRTASLRYSRGVQTTSPASPATSELPPIPWAAVGVGFAAMFVVTGVRTAFAVLYPAIVAEMEWSVGQVTGAFSSGLLVYGPTALAVGVLVDRLGCRATMLVGCVLLIVGLGLVALAAELWHLYIAFTLAAGFGSAAVGFITVVKLVSLSAGRRFPTAFALAFLGTGIGALVMGPTLQAVLELAGWRAAALLMAALVLAGLLPLVATLAPGREAHPERHTAGRGVMPRARGALFAAFFLGNASLGYLMLVPTHQVAQSQSAGFSPMTSASAAGLWGALTSVGGVAGGLALERWGPGWLAVVAALLFGLGTAALILSTPESAWLLALFVVVSGLGRGVLGIPLVAAQTRAFAGPRLGSITGRLDLGYGLGAFLGPWLTAVVLDASGSYGPGLASAIASATLVAVGTALGARLARDGRAAPRP